MNEMPLQPTQEEDGRWPIWKLAILLYPFAAGAVAINLFMLFLMLQVLGFEAISPESSVVWGIFLGVPAAWAFARWARRLMDEADA
ncbi:hypothetical protein [Primorskyibacter sp. S187A]|uniref:hypothetical protein n=1 Tax=Primorskyibacter sp. S187A TaxID=3415130 RepID=UPI003C7A9CAF